MRLQARTNGLVFRNAAIGQNLVAFIKGGYRGKLQPYFKNTAIAPFFFSWPNGKCLEVNEKINMKKLSGNRTLDKYMCEFVCVFSEFGFTNLKIMTSMAKICIVDQDKKLEKEV